MKFQCAEKKPTKFPVFIVKVLNQTGRQIGRSLHCVLGNLNCFEGGFRFKFRCLCFLGSWLVILHCLHALRPWRIGSHILSAAAVFKKRFYATTLKQNLRLILTALATLATRHGVSKAGSSQQNKERNLDKKHP